MTGVIKATYMFIKKIMSSLLRSERQFDVLSLNGAQQCDC